jgi:CheY-like chemotaxis protein
MRKKILIAEKSDAIRGIAESILHQYGYDVLTASTTEKAKELIITSEPNMVIIGADLKDADGKYLYDLLEGNERTATIPLLLIADPDGDSPAYPEEVILPRPFNHKDFIEKVRLFVGGGNQASGEEKIDEVESFPADSVDEEFLDEALGLDRIEVEDSEVMNKTWTGKTRAKDRGKGKDAYDLHQPDEEDKVKADTVESLMIREDKTEADSGSKPPKKESSASSKIEIADDQYGLMSPQVDAGPGLKGADPSHDYSWFIDEMQKESVGPQSRPKKEHSDEEIQGRHGGEAIEPVHLEKEKTAEKPEIMPGGVDEFISDFKKQIEQIRSETGKVPVQNVEKTAAATEEEKPGRVAQVTPAFDEAEIRHFCNNLVDILAEKLAKKIVDKIDKNELYVIVQRDLKRIISEQK